MAAGLLLALVGTAQANTSQTCLRRCLATCAEQGRAADEACLRSCLRDCPVHCGTVDEDCALGCVKDPGELAKGPATDPANAPANAPAKIRAQDQVEDWLTGRATDRPDLAARCSEACTVKPVCRSSAYDTGPAKLTPAAPLVKPRGQ